MLRKSISYYNMLYMNPLINLMHLKFFCDAVIYKSVSEAAKMNYVTQSAVSQAISKLERIVGSDLVVHNRQKFQITEEGQIVFDQARYIFKAVQDTFDKVNECKQEITGSVKFVSTHSLVFSYIPYAYQLTKQNIPTLDLSFSMGNLNFIRNALKREEAEFGIVVYDQDFSQYAKHPLKQGRFNLYHTESAPHHLIENGILIDFHEGMYVNDLKEITTKKGTPLKIQAELSGWEAVARFTEMNMGIGFIPDYIAASNRYPSLKVFPQEIPHLEYQICAIYNKDARLSRGASAFLEQFSN